MTTTGDLFYSEMAELVQSMLSDFGTDITLTRTDPVTGDVTSYTIRGCFTDPVTYRIRPVELGQPDIRIVCDNAVKPMDTDTIVHSRGQWIVTRVDPIQPASTVLGYRIEGQVG